MSRRSRVVSPVAALGAVILASAVFAASPSTPGDAWARKSLVGYTAPDGGTYFAIPLKAAGTAPRQAVSRDHVILVDTSASQAGSHRRQALAVVKSLLATLPRGDRVRLFAVDLKTDALTSGFIAPQGDDANKAFAALNRRYPAGATDLVAAMSAASSSFPSSSLGTRTKRAGSILYVGDGLSTANLLQAENVQKLVSDLRGRRIPVHSYAVGPRKDLQTLGMFAQQTGGCVAVDRGDAVQDAPTATAGRLATALAGSVLYPKSIDTSKALSVSPSYPLPLRWDRETIVLGKVTGSGELRVTVKAGNEAVLDGAAATHPSGVAIASHVLPRKSLNGGHSYLRVLWNRAEQSNGLSVALAGRELLNAAHDDFNDRLSQLVAAGERAIAVRRLNDAAKVAKLIRELDPNNTQAKALLGAAGALQGNKLALVQPKKTAGAKKADPLSKAAKTAKEDDSVAAQRAIRAVKLQQMQREVRNRIQRAREVAPSNPDGAIGMLKETLETVNATEQIDIGPRQDLLRQIRTTIQDINSRKEVLEGSRIRQLERQAQIEAQKRLLDKLRLEQEQLETLIDQVRALIEDGVHGDDVAYDEAKQVAYNAVDLEPGEGTAAAALFVSEAAGQLSKAFRLRSLRADRWLETLYQVELSHVPFPDEPPVRWPSAEVWQDLTERRKKWASVDLHKNSPAEEKIRSELLKNTKVEFDIGVSLRDAMADIAENHGITIIPDRKPLDDAQIKLEELQTRFTLSGIKLKSVLKIILEEHGLTYTIDDEVMKITTIEAANEKLQTRVYPVGELVISPSIMLLNVSSGGLGGAGGLGGGGVLGGGLGGIGGGLGGGGLGGGLGGGGLGGGLGGGFGGGLFSVPPANVRAPRNVPRINKPKPVGDAEAQNLLDNILGAVDQPSAFPTQMVAFLDDAPVEIKKKAIA